MRKLRHFVLIILKHDLNRSFELCHIDCNWQESPDMDRWPETQTMIKGTYRSLPLRNPYPSVSETNFTRIWYYFRFFDLDSNSSVPLYWSPWWLFCASYEYQGSMVHGPKLVSPGPSSSVLELGPNWTRTSKIYKSRTGPGSTQFWKSWIKLNRSALGLGGPWIPDSVYWWQRAP